MRNPNLSLCGCGSLSCCHASWCSAVSSSAPCFSDRTSEPYAQDVGFYGDLIFFFSALVCIPSSVILLAFLISAKHQDDISRRFSVITLEYFLCGVTVNTAKGVSEIRFVCSRYIHLQRSTLILMTSFCPFILNGKILLISSW